MSDIRINMIVTRDENPDLHALLEGRSPKLRASVLRQYADRQISQERMLATMARVADAGFIATMVPLHGFVLAASTNVPSDVPGAPKDMADNKVPDGMVISGVDLGGLD